MVTSAFSGPLTQSLELVGGIGSAVGKAGVGVFVGTGSVGVAVGPSAGGVLVLVGWAGEAVGVGEVHAAITTHILNKQLIKISLGVRGDG
jgi:hypothetical protein